MSDMKEILSDFDSFLEEKGERFECILIGGAALRIMDVVSRFTRDADVLDPAIPDPIKDASVEFAEQYEKEELSPEWFNDTAKAFSYGLPKGWRTRTVKIFNGKSLSFETLGRTDFIKTKVYAYCNRGSDLDDLKSLEVTEKELDDALPWLKERMPEKLFGDQVETSMAVLKEEINLDLQQGL